MTKPKEPQVRRLLSVYDGHRSLRRIQRMLNRYTEEQD
jgi:hypothetical protein